MATEKGDVTPLLPHEERGKPSFAGDLAKSVLTVLRNGLIASLKPHAASEPTINNPLLQQTQLLRDLRFYETGLNQISILARAERAKVAIICLDMMPGLMHPSPTTPDYMISHKTLSYEQISTALGLNGPHESIQVRNHGFLPSLRSSFILTPVLS
jgi:hypothetical protein